LGRVNSPLYARVLRDGWIQLAAPVRCVHDTQTAVRDPKQAARPHGGLRVVHTTDRRRQLSPAVTQHPRVER